MKEYSIPVEWAVFDTVKVKANSLQEAVQYVKDNIDSISLGTNPEYIDGSYKISVKEQHDVEKMANEIAEFYMQD